VHQRSSLTTSSMTNTALLQQALQALQRQPNAAQYFQQLMLQQQINNAQLQNLAAVQQVKVCVCYASSKWSLNICQILCSLSLSQICQAIVTSGSTTSSRPMGAPATSTISQSVLLSGTAGGQGQMYLRVNRSLRAPISSQLIFMPGNTATAAVATVTQQPQAQQQQSEVTPTSSSSSQSDNDQVQNLAMRGMSSPKGVGVKTELNSQSPTKPSQSQHQPPHIKIPTYPQPTNLKAHPSSSGASSSSSSSIPLSQLLLHGTRTLTTGTTAPTAAHTLVLASSTASQAHGYPVGTATIKPAVNAQTLVVQPLQKTSLSAEKSGNGPIPIQPKLQGLRLPLQLPSRNPPPILPAPPPVSSSAPPPPPPHIPVQIVGARQSTLGNAQALALARGNSCCQDGAAVLSSSSSLLTMVASIASREGGVVGRGVGLKTLQSPQEAPPLAQVSQVHPQANQSSRQAQNGPLASSPASSQAPAVPSPPSSMSLYECECNTIFTFFLLLSFLPLGPPLTTGSGAPPPASSSPSPVLSVSRGVCQGERAPPPQAVVKPNVLTHLIEGFVIQEGAEPFPVSTWYLFLCLHIFFMYTVLKCEYCKNFAPASQFRGTKRFCSMSCAKRYFNTQTHTHTVRPGNNPVQPQTSTVNQYAIFDALLTGSSTSPPVQCRSESSHSDEESSGEEDEDDPMSLSPASSASCHQPPPPLPTESSAPSCLPASPAQWSAEDVSQFISSLQGCEDLASQFLSQEIDGQALLLLKEEHLMSTMNIKLGPALKICAHINTLRD
uniref:Polyhomeotic homolog 1 n=1 Tax=Sander lucioperca TaxID=283035 RepID=A0A8C9XTF1_SANLU